MADHGQGRGIGGHGHLDWGERPVPFVVWGAGALPGAVSREERSVCELATTVSTLLGVEAPAAARGRPMVPELDSCVERGASAGRALAVVVARDEEPAVGRVLAGLPATACGMPVDVLLVDDGSRDTTAAIGREHGARVLSHEHSRGLGAALRAGLELARDEGYAAAVYLDGDGEYDPADFARVLDPVARGRADYVIGSRFLGAPAGMSWHRRLANRTTSALVGFLAGTVAGDAQSGYRAFSARALAAARIRHDYNYAQVLTLSLWGARIEPVEVPISYSRRTSGRSFVRYPEYLVRVAPAVWREWRASRATRRSATPPIAPASANGQVSSVLKSGSSAGERPERRVRPAGHERAAEEARVGVDPGAAKERQRRERGARLRRVPEAECDERDGERQRGEQVPRREPEAEHGGGEEGRHEQLDAEHQRAEPAGELHLADVGQHTREALPVEAPEPPEPGEGEREHRRPAQQPVIAIDEQGHEPVGAVGVPRRERGVGGGLALGVGGVGGHAAVDRLVDGHVEHGAEERDLDRPHGERAPARSPYRRARRETRSRCPRARTWCRARGGSRAGRSTRRPRAAAGARPGAARAGRRRRARRRRSARGRRRCRRRGRGG